jgi:membrane protein
VGLAYGTAGAQDQIIDQVQQFMGQDAATAVQGMLEASRKPSTNIIATIVGLLTLFLGASSVVGELRDALNTIWGVMPPQGGSGFKALLGLLRGRFFSFAMVLGIGFLLLVSLVVSAWLAAVGKYFQQWVSMPVWTMQVVNILISLLVVTALFAVIYKFLPDVAIAWSDVGVGALVTAILFTIGKTVIGIYLGQSSFSSTYGAAASVVIILVWVYYSAQIFFLGAEFTRIYAKRFGSHVAQRHKPVEQPEPQHAG